MIEARDLAAGYEPGRLALDALTLDVRPGSLYVLLGKRGSGKRTFLRVLRGSLKPVAGSVTVDGLDVGQHPIAVRHRLAFASGASGLYGDLSPLRSATLFARLAGQKPTRRDVTHALRRSGLPERLFDAPARQLDAPARLSVSVATGLLRAVSGFVLDEPTDGADRRAASNIEDVAGDLRESGHTVFVTTSDVSFAAAVGDRVGILQDGRLDTECTARQLLEWSLPDFLVEFAGGTSLPANRAPSVGC